MGRHLFRGLLFWGSHCELHRCAFPPAFVNGRRLPDPHPPIELLILLFAGLQKWRQNLQLLVPFLEDPQIELFSLKHLDGSIGQGAAQLRVGTFLQRVEIHSISEQQALLCGRSASHACCALHIRLNGGSPHSCGCHGDPSLMFWVPQSTPSMMRRSRLVSAILSASMQAIA